LCFLSPCVQATPVPVNSLANTNRSLPFHGRFVRHCKASTGSGTTASYWVLSAVYDATRVPIGAKDFSLAPRRLRSRDRSRTPPGGAPRQARRFVELRAGFTCMRGTL